MSDQPIVPAAPAAPEAPAASAPAAPAAPSAPAAAAPATPPAEPAASNAADEVWSDPVKAKAEIERLRKENAKDRTSAKQNAAEQAQADTLKKVGELLGFVKPEDAAPDPAALTAQIAEANAEAHKTKVALAVFQNAGTAGADPAALLDSASFLASVAQLDPSDPAAVTAAIQAAVTANPRLGAAPGSRLPLPNPAQGSSGAGAATLTPEQEARAAEKSGNFALAGAIKADQLAKLREASPI